MSYLQSLRYRLVIGVWIEYCRTQFFFGHWPKFFRNVRKLFWRFGLMSENFLLSSDIHFCKSLYNEVLNDSFYRRFVLVIVPGGFSKFFLFWSELAITQKNFLPKNFSNVRNFSAKKNKQAEPHEFDTS